MHVPYYSAHGAGMATLFMRVGIPSRSAGTTFENCVTMVRSRTRVHVEGEGGLLRYGAPVGSWRSVGLLRNILEGVGCPALVASEEGKEEQRGRERGW